MPDWPGHFEPTPLAEAWDGQTWTQLPTANLPAGAAMSSVSCTDPANCVAVGGGYTAQQIPFGVAAAWNGTAWTPLPDPMASLTRISCLSAAGGSGPSGTRGHGGPGSPRTTGSPASRVSPRTSTVTCIALGTNLSSPGSPVAESWNGSSWTQVPLPSPLPYRTELNGLSCGGLSSCVAVGTATVPGSLAMTWNGARWRINRASKLDMLAGVSCAAVGRCVATGGYVGESDAPRGLAETLTGSSWRTTKLAGGDIGNLADVSCGSSNCVAVGARGLALNSSLAERWDGRTWRMLPEPSGGGLSAVSCVQADCLATRPTSADWWNGTRWRQVNAPLPNFFEGGGITDVSCAGTARCLASGAYDYEPCCLATGHHVAVQSGYVAFAESWDGKSLRRLEPSGDGLGSVSCVTTSFCMTVASDEADLWNGRFRGDLRLPGHFGSPGLVAVSCASTVACMAVGDYVVNLTPRAVAVVWNGASWRRIALPTAGIYLTDVSCPAATWCVAVGYSYHGQAATHALTALWNGTRWQILRTPSP